MPDGSLVAGVVERGAPAKVLFSKEARIARSVVGPWDAAISGWAGRPLHLVAFDRGSGIDRGPSVSVVSTAALAELARVGGQPAPLDGRRFRMTFGVDDVPAYAEDRWVGREVRIGAATVAVAGNVGRCAVTTQDPDTGRRTFDTLGTIQRTRGTLETSEPLPFGVWAEVVRPAIVACGDPVQALAPGAAGR